MIQSPEVLHRTELPGPDKPTAESVVSSLSPDEQADLEAVSTLKQSQIKEDQRERERILIQIQIQDFGLADAHKFSEDLLELQETGTPLEPVFKQMSQLEHIAPGVIDWLHSEMNIVNFGRYPAELLMSMYESDPAMPWGIVVYPRQEVNYLPGVDMWPLKLMHDSIGDQVQPIIVEADSTGEIVRLFSKFTRQRGPASFCLMTSLSKSEGLNMSSSPFGEITRKSLDEDPSFCDALKDGLVKDAEIILCSSSTGRLGGIAEQISRRTNRTVLAPTGTIDEALYGATVIDGRVSFSPEFGGPSGNVQVRAVHPSEVISSADEVQDDSTVPQEPDQDTSEADPATV